MSDQQRPPEARHDTSKPAQLRKPYANGSESELDPRAVLTSIGEMIYDWNILSDALAWSSNVADVLGLEDPAPLATGAGYGLMVEPGSGITRNETIGLASGTRYGWRRAVSDPLQFSRCPAVAVLRWRIPGAGMQGPRGIPYAPMGSCGWRPVTPR